MQVTKELLVSEIASTEARLEQAKASANHLAGALSVLKEIVKFMDAEEPKPPEEISEENAAIQKREEDNALSMKQIAEAVAGLGAEAEIVEEKSNDAAR